MSYTIILQYSEGRTSHTPVDPKKTEQKVTTIKDAKAAFCAWRDRNDLGSSHLTTRAGKLYCGAGAKGRVVGKFSYNGRLWSPEGSEILV